MPRPLLALAAIAVTSVAVVCVQTATHRAVASAPASNVEGTVTTHDATIGTAPAVDSHAPAKPIARSTAPRHVASPPATSLVASHGPGAAMKIGADPLTDQVIAPEHSGTVLTIAEMQALAHEEGRGLFTIRNADGSETLNHEGRFMNHLIVRLGPDGRPVFSCVDGAVGVDHALHHTAPATANMEDR